MSYFPGELGAILERLLGRLEAEIAAQPMDYRERFQILQIKEKFGQLTVYLADSTRDMDAVIRAPADESTRTCEVCGAPGELKQRDYWWAPRCGEHAVCGRGCEGWSAAGELAPRGPTVWLPPRCEDREVRTRH